MVAPQSFLRALPSILTLVSEKVSRELGYATATLRDPQQAGSWRLDARTHAAMVLLPQKQTVDCAQQTAATARVFSSG